MNLFRKPILPIEWELLNHDDKNYSSEEEPDVEEVCVKMVNLKKKAENNIRHRLVIRRIMIKNIFVRRYNVYCNENVG